MKAFLVDRLAAREQGVKGAPTACNARAPERKATEVLPLLPVISKGYERLLKFSYGSKKLWNFGQKSRKNGKIVPGGKHSLSHRRPWRRCKKEASFSPAKSDVQH
jgi:hypothetical protein